MESPLSLPPEVAHFLSEGRQLEYDSSPCVAGKITLHSLDELKLGHLWVDNTDYDSEEKQTSYYAIPAVSLSRECEGYSPEFLLCWLPNEQMFGAWDIDHWVLTTFPTATWAKIVANPLAYLNAQWGNTEVAVIEFDPSRDYVPISGWPF